MTDLSAEQGTPEWLAERVGKITCSRLKDMLAYNTKTYVDNAENRKLGRAGVTVVTELQDRKDYKIQVALERITGTSTPVFENFAMRAGTDREPAARRIYEHRHGYSVGQVGFIPHAMYPFAGGSPDGVMIFDDGDRGGLELKCPQLEQHFENLVAIESGVLPEKYRAQVQGIMWVTACKWLDWCSFNPDFPQHLEFGCLRVERDEAYIKTLEVEVLKFEGEVCELVDRLNAMNGGPVAAPVRLRDLEVPLADDDIQEYPEWAIASRLIEEQYPQCIFHDVFEPSSWSYERSEIHATGAFHIFKRPSDGAVEAVPASESWVEENRLWAQR